MEEAIDFVDKHYKLIIFGAILVGIGFVIWVLVTAISLEVNKNTYLTLSFAPTEAVLTIDGANYRTGTYEFEPGKYMGELHCEGFNSKTIEIDIKSRQVTTVTDYLVNEAEGMAYYEKYAADIEVLRYVSNDENVSNFLNLYDQKYSLMKYLPLDASFDNRAETGFPSQDLVSVKIKNGLMHKDCEGTLCLVIVGQKVKDEIVKSVLIEKGYKIEDYEVIYEKDW